ncbi:MAG: aldo/keto reductase, partial [Deltaproteobacteria bacterium]
MDYQEEEQPRHVAEYYFVLVKHKWMIGAVLVLTLALVYLYNSRQKPVYRATATMVIESERRRSPISGQIMNYESFYFGSLAFNTHCRLITSRPVLERVIKDLGMDQESAPEKLEAGPLQGLLSRLKKNLFILLRKKEKPPLASEKKPGIRAALTGRIHIKPVKDTRLLKINVEDTDPRKAQRTANSLATAYIAFNIENHMKSSKNTLTW